jgi:hypothetical protein
MWRVKGRGLMEAAMPAAAAAAAEALKGIAS